MIILIVAPEVMTRAALLTFCQPHRMLAQGFCQASTRDPVGAVQSSSGKLQ